MLIGEGEIFGEGPLLDYCQTFSVVVHSQTCTVLKVKHEEFRSRYSLVLPQLKAYSQRRHEHMKKILDRIGEVRLKDRRSIID